MNVKAPRRMSVTKGNVTRRKSFTQELQSTEDMSRVLESANQALENLQSKFSSNLQDGWKGKKAPKHTITAPQPPPRIIAPRGAPIVRNFVPQNASTVDYSQIKLRESPRSESIRLPEFPPSPQSQAPRPSFTRTQRPFNSLVSALSHTGILPNTEPQASSTLKLQTDSSVGSSKDSHLSVRSEKSSDGSIYQSNQSSTGSSMTFNHNSSVGNRMKVGGNVGVKVNPLKMTLESRSRDIRDPSPSPDFKGKLPSSSSSPRTNLKNNEVRSNLNSEGVSPDI